MAYIVTSSEKTRSSASEFETKALLYLMNLCEEHDKCFYFVIDVYNDVSAHSVFFEKSWDLQSKANKEPSPKEIGKELVTLFKNYLSSFNFDYSILFLGGVSTTFRVSDELKTFGISNVKSSAKDKLIEGLKEAINEKSYIDAKTVDDKKINAFLAKVTFVIDDKNKVDYIKDCIKLGKKVLPSDAELERIFNSIRDIQSSFKNNGNVEGVVLNDISEGIMLNRHFEKNDIKMKILSDLTGGVFEKNTIPNHFYDIIKDLNASEREDLVEHCFLDMCMVYFDKNNEINFWKLFAHIYTTIEANKDKKVDELYAIIDKNKLSKVRNLNANTAKYFISLVMEVVL